MKGHSEKPAEAYELIEEMFPNHTYLELFARNHRAGWRSWGNQLEDESVLDVPVNRERATQV